MCVRARVCASLCVCVCVQVLPGDGPYSSASKIQNTLVDKRPLGVVYAESEADVVRTVAAVRNWSVPVAVRSGGHSYVHCI